MGVDFNFRSKYNSTCPNNPNVLLTDDDISRTRELDVWKRKYIVLCDAYQLRVISRGSDGKLGTADDIVEVLSLGIQDPPLLPPTDPN
jgi:hypothetical protein